MTLDESVKEAILRYPTEDIIRRLYPDVPGGRRVLCNPIRGERNPSLSCFRDREGVSRWKDHATGETGDNIDFYRLAFPGCGFAEAVDALSSLVLGVSGPAVRSVAVGARQAATAGMAPALRIVSDTPFLSPGTPGYLAGYCRARGISDEVSSRYCRCVVFENTRLSGAVRVDRRTGVPIMGPDGKPERVDPTSVAVAMRNDIGGYSLRVPAAGGRRDFKGCDRSFPTTIYADGSAPAGPIRLSGRGDGRVAGLYYDGPSWTLLINRTQGFRGVPPAAARHLLPFLGRWSGRVLDGRDLMAAEAVAGVLSGPVGGSVTVVEGLFDALSVIEIRRMRGRGAFPGSDLVVLNSVNNISWAVPFLSMHSEVRSLLDVDLLSGAGQRAYARMADEVGAHAAVCGTRCSVSDGSALFAPYKDVNDSLVAWIRGAGKGEGAAGAQKKNCPGVPGCDDDIVQP